MAADGILYVTDPTAAQANWQRVFSLRSLGLGSITRMAVDARSRRIAIVAADEFSEKE
jgi:hypothetical protein